MSFFTRNNTAPDAPEPPKKNPDTSELTERWWAACEELARNAKPHNHEEIFAKAQEYRKNRIMELAERSAQELVPNPTLHREIDVLLGEYEHARA